MPPRSTTRTLVVAGKQAAELTVAQLSVRVIEGPERGLELAAAGELIEIGADSANDLCLTDTTVSRRHAIVRTSPDGVVVEDLGSKNGTWVNDVRVKSALLPVPGCVRLGRTVLEVLQATERILVFPHEEPTFCGMVGIATPMRAVFSLIQQLAKHDLPVSILGETGTGKEMAARALHDSGPRRTRPFQVLDCGSLVKELLASELSGHEKGAFTGADQMRKGIFEAADGGTVFLDEVGEIDLSLQPQLLRILETHEVRRLGSRETIPVRFRLISATNRDLHAMAASGAFRTDLLYRLSGAVLELPPLRNRTDDLPELSRHFIAEYVGRNGLPRTQLSSAAATALAAHSWPGNLRELRRACEFLVVLTGGGEIQPEHVKEVLKKSRLESSVDGDPAGRETRSPVTPSVSGGAPPEPAPATLAGAVDRLEREAILRAIADCGGNRKEAARKLGISRSALYPRLERLGVAADDPGSPSGGKTPGPQHG